MSNQELREKLHKSIITKFEKRKGQSSFIDTNWSADLAHMQLISKLNKEIRFLVCVIDDFNKYTWVFPLKDKKGITISNVFQKILHESGPNQTKYG